MTDPSFLAVSLLTAGSVSVPPPPVPPHWRDNFRAILEGRKAALDQVSENTSIPTVDPVEPEFSLSSEPLPASNAQLYRQRLSALKAGKLYTRLSSSSFYEDWVNATKQPTHEQWKTLLDWEAKAISKGQGSNRLNILVGDSLSMWFPSQLLPRGKFWLNQGISGENSGQIRQRLQAFKQTRPATIYLMAGINDLRQGAEDREILNNIRESLKDLRSTHPQAEIVVQSILPTRVATLSNDRIRFLNRQIFLIAQQEGAGYLNLHDLFADEQGMMRSQLTTDGLHLNRQGYRVWQSAIQQAESWLIANRR